MDTFKLLEFNKILEKLSELTMSESAKEKSLQLKPFLSEKEVKAKMEETTQAKKILETFGNPPISFMLELEKIIDLSKNGSMLIPEQLTAVASFIYSCNKMKSYLKKAEELEVELSLTGNSFYQLEDLLTEIENCIKGTVVSDNASTYLRDIRKKILHAQENIKAKLEAILRSKKDCLSDNYIVTRNGKFVLPVKKSHKNQISGSVIDISSTNTTLFIEPDAVNKLQDELTYLEIEEDCEVRKILYNLTALVEDNSYSLEINKECMELLDFAFAKAKLSEDMNGINVAITTERKMEIKKGRHPLIDKDVCVPLDFKIGENETGIIITGPNTGGKTVALKTVGLLSLMAQSGLHVPVLEGSVFTMFSNVLADIGDGQSILENLSTFSAHIKNIINILSDVTNESLVIVDELGSGTDPTEGMGIAISILEELRRKKCLFVATTHYPEIKDYAKNTDGLINARMDFDLENLKPLYKLQIGEAGTSYALQIAKKLGFPEHMLHRAEKEAYGKSDYNSEIINDDKKIPNAKIQKEKRINKPKSSFVMGDSVEVYPEKEIGIVYKTEDKKGNLIVQIKGVKKEVNYKRLVLKAEASELYPDDYDFSIIFNTVEERKRFKQGFEF